MTQEFMQHFVPWRRVTSNCNDVGIGHAKDAPRRLCMRGGSGILMDE